MFTSFGINGNRIFSEQLSVLPGGKLQRI